MNIVCAIMLLFLSATSLFAWRKICREFRKRFDPEVLYCYCTTAHDRFYEDVMPDFNTKSSKKQRLLPRRELLRQDVGRRTTFAVHGAGSLRVAFHNVPIELPPLCPQDQLQ